MSFDFTDLRLFVNVLDAGTITAGAAASFVTLASASERIRGMEAALGIPLLVRDRRGISPTPAGRTLQSHALIVLQQLDRMQGDLGDHASGLRGHVRMMCNSAAISDWLPDRLADFLCTHPGISVDLDERASQEIVDAIRGNTCDIGVLADSVDTTGLQSFLLGNDPLMLVMPRDHEWVRRKQVSFAEVAHCPLVGLQAGSALDDHLAGHARRLGVRLRYRIRLRSFEAICRMVGQGVGLGVVPRSAAQRYARSAKAKAISLTDPWAGRSLVICVRDAEVLPAHARQLIERLRQLERSATASA
ncbi:LysR substrate-binding domain-containing protein [Aquabacterium sp. CECT 9606]|uniref:LysR substrate-binding domain-containing protein n=1 Tax=Aquabacterium sp. CECT 9606 TaxID=2845822 RepID=UPI001E631DE7|nr:LysR substrate-binding domain-containing protein [Aquabacterium sp. CECT 9606]CAH0347883.1 HTH-type transcriptional regulator CynR [Aquabacterium sp. CECT 9606]